MKITKKLQIVALAALSLGIASLCSAQSDAPFTEGPVWNITMVKVKPGLGDQYLKGLAKTLKGTLDEAKKQDFNILVMVESKNMAALDNAREKFDPITKKVVGSTEEQEKTAVQRLEIREIMGNKLMREITLK